MLINGLSRVPSVFDRSRRGWLAVFCVLFVAGCGGGDAGTSSQSSPGSGSQSSRSAGATATTTESTTVTVTTTESTTPSPRTPISIDSFTTKEVQAAKYEAIGCWLRKKGADESIFFTGYDGGFMVIDGEPVLLDKKPGTVDSVIDIADSYSNADYTVRLVDIGEPTPTSIESTDRDATLKVVASSGETTSIEGVLGCGV